MNELVRSTVYQSIKRNILSGIYQQGEQLSANKLAEKYNISTTPVREALNALEQEGFIESKPRVGFFVAQVTIKDVHDIFEYRIIVEGASAELAAHRITDDELNYLASIPSDYIIGDTDSYMDYLKNNRDFHISVARASRNQFIIKAVTMIMDQIQRMTFLGIGSSEYSDVILRAHPQLVDALKERNPHASQKIMIDGIIASRDAAINQIIHGSLISIKPPELDH